MGEVKSVSNVSNVYSKMQNIRCQLLEEPLEKSGNNKFANFKYFELSDFLPTITRLLKENGLCSCVTFTNDEAKLVIINVDKPEEKLEFTSPMSTAAVAKNGNEVQNLGAVQTYLRRYLYVAAFEIVENDGLDAATGTTQLIEKLLKETGTNRKEFLDFLFREFGVKKLDDLTPRQSEWAIKTLEKRLGDKVE